MDFSKVEQFEALCGEAQNCRLCPNLAERIAVLSDLNGPLHPKVLFIAEAPGRQGADRTRRPFYGDDNSGKNFQILIDSINLRREEIFITNAVLCSPRGPTGANRKPTRREVKDCSGFLRRTIDLIDSRIIATLGAVALDAIKTIERHDLTLKTNAGRAVKWNGRILIPLYHPSPQTVAAQRGLSLQLGHFQALDNLLRD